MKRWQTITNLWPLKQIKRRLTGCCLLVVLGLLLVCAALLGMLFLFTRLVSAQSAPQTSARDVLLIIDNSASMYEKAGMGSDPDLRRIESARHFINYLGVDSSHAHRLGIVFFGSQAELVVPLTFLSDDARRAELSDLIDDPQSMGWTDPEAALELALDTLTKTGTGSGTRPAVVLLTDGKPERRNNPSDQEIEETMAGLRHAAQRLAAADIPLFIIQLQNRATDKDPAIEAVFTPLWQELAGLTPAGHFYHARHSEELLDIYHDIVVTLTGHQTDGVVWQTQVQTQTSRTVPVDPNLAQVTLVIRKSDPAIKVQIIHPDGQLLTTADPAVQHAGRPGYSREEIWAITYPAPGNWQVRLNGQGRVTVWRDYIPVPATATFTPAPTVTHTPIPSPTSSPTATPAPAVAQSSPVPSPGVTPSPVPPAATPPSLPAYLLWLIAMPVLGGVAGGGYWLWRYQMTRPRLGGSLRLVSAPPHIQPSLPARFDLDAAGRRVITLGPEAGHDLHLPDTFETPTPPAQLMARPDADGRPDVVLAAMSAELTVLVNELPVYEQSSLKDGDLITLGAYRFKYENIRRRTTWPGNGVRPL